MKIQKRQNFWCVKEERKVFWLVDWFFKISPELLMWETGREEAGMRCLGMRQGVRGGHFNAKKSHTQIPFPLLTFSKHWKVIRFNEAVIVLRILPSFPGSLLWLPRYHSCSCGAFRIHFLGRFKWPVYKDCLFWDSMAGIKFNPSAFKCKEKGRLSPFKIYNL